MAVDVQRQLGSIPPESLFLNYRDKSTNDDASGILELSGGTDVNDAFILARHQARWQHNFNRFSGDRELPSIWPFLMPLPTR